MAGANHKGGHCKDKQRAGLEWLLGLWVKTLDGLDNASRRKGFAATVFVSIAS